MQIQTNTNRFKEPRGFIKIIQFFVAILAFSITAGYYSEYKYSITSSVVCNGKNKTMRIEGKFSYPFGEVDTYDGAIFCFGKSVEPTHEQKGLPARLKSSSQFFVFVGVMAFLYCIGAMVYYVCLEDIAQYGPGGTGRTLASFATVDFIVTIVFAVAWFCASAAWASGLAKLKDVTDVEDFCKKPFCEILDKANYAGITISVLFGFLSVFLWGANVWFVFKETMWHKEPGATATAEQPSGEVPRQEVPGESLP